MKTLGVIDGVQSYAAAEDDRFITGTVQDCTPILEDAQRRHVEGLHGTAEMKHAARLPMAIIETYCNVNGISFEQWMTEPQHLKRMLADPDLRGFRVWSGAV